MCGLTCLRNRVYSSSCAVFSRSDSRPVPANTSTVTKARLMTSASGSDGDPAAFEDTIWIILRIGRLSDLSDISRRHCQSSRTDAHRLALSCHYRYDESARTLAAVREAASCLVPHCCSSLEHRLSVTVLASELPRAPWGYATHLFHALGFVKSGARKGMVRPTPGPGAS